MQKSNNELMVSFSLYVTEVVAKTQSGFVVDIMGSAC